MKFALPVAMLLPLLIACVPEAQEVDIPAPSTPLADDTCGANRFQDLIGQTAPTITVPANAPYRSYRTGDPVTMDFNMKRLNFEHDKSGKLVRVSCG
ncbi:MAG TPA: I78 family peptidase inhibitor [Paracoccus sp. (in: a-proteobacteria)]|uniref:I78 family peptidase inhibitor n=1 Tax=Paracoccus sp. TaxID=267 RepID=UPI002C1A5C20|nr:I78 family peptidase inhibitor [Paracoccus sp. (in: a-proteobacteria)]HWL56706.1 I78 family peptidase inhibitor [Paracoccus sp. (in: a-proteobacteria)]